MHVRYQDVPPIGGYRFVGMSFWKQMGDSMIDLATPQDPKGVQQ